MDRARCHDIARGLAGWRTTEGLDADGDNSAFGQFTVKFRWQGDFALAGLRQDAQRLGWIATANQPELQRLLLRLARSDRRHRQTPVGGIIIGQKTDGAVLAGQ